MHDWTTPMERIMRVVNWWENNQWRVMFWVVVIGGAIGFYFGLKE